MQKFLTLDMGQFCHNQFSIYQLKFARFSSQAKQNFSTTLLSLSSTTSLCVGALLLAIFLRLLCLLVVTTSASSCRRPASQYHVLYACSHKKNDLLHNTIYIDRVTDRQVVNSSVSDKRLGWSVRTYIVLQEAMQQRGTRVRPWSWTPSLHTRRVPRIHVGLCDEESGAIQERRAQLVMCGGRPVYSDAGLYI